VSDAAASSATPEAESGATDKSDKSDNPTKGRRMAVKFGSLKADIAKEQAGDWVPIPELPGVEFKVKSFNDPAYRVARDLLIQKMARKHGKRPAPPDETESAFGKLYARHILLDWRGFDVEYSAGVALEALGDPAYRDLRRHVEYAASQVGETDIQFEEEALGESESA